MIRHQTMGDLADQGFTKDQVLEALRILPFVSDCDLELQQGRKSHLNGADLSQHPAMKRAVLSLKERLPDTTFLCLSNSNEVYIATILEVSSDGPGVCGWSRG